MFGNTLWGTAVSAGWARVYSSWSPFTRAFSLKCLLNTMQKAWLSIGVILRAVLSLIAIRVGSWVPCHECREHLWPFTECCVSLLRQSVRLFFRLRKVQGHSPCPRHCRVRTHGQVECLEEAAKDDSGRMSSTELGEQLGGGAEGGWGWSAQGVRAWREAVCQWPGGPALISVTGCK